VSGIRVPPQPSPFCGWNAAAPPICGRPLWSRWRVLTKCAPRPLLPTLWNETTQTMFLGDAGRRRSSPPPQYPAVTARYPSRAMGRRLFGHCQTCAVLSMCAWRTHARCRAHRPRAVKQIGRCSRTSHSCSCRPNARARARSSLLWHCDYMVNTNSVVDGHFKNSTDAENDAL
jgi:hypothetical protein